MSGILFCLRNNREKESARRGGSSRTCVFREPPQRASERKRPTEVGHGKAGFLPAGRSLGARCQQPSWRRAGLVSSVAAEIANIVMQKSINTAAKLSQKESDGIALHSECSAPSANITTQARKAQAAVGIPTMIKIMKSFPFMVAKHLLSLLDGFSLLIL